MGGGLSARPPTAACGGRPCGPYPCGLQGPAAGKGRYFAAFAGGRRAASPGQKSRKPAITHENPGKGSDCAGRGPQAPAKKPQARNNPRKPGERQRLCGPQARRLRRRNGLRPFARRRERRAACGPPPALHKPDPTENSRQALRPSGVILSRYSVIRRCRPPRQSPTALPHHR